MSMHTPGPWTSQPGYLTVYSTASGITNAVASMLTKQISMGSDVVWEQAVANSRLIAAAPDLLEVVKDIVSDCKGVVHPSLYDLAVKAIAKAEGGAA